jgi:Na+/H+ antiporter NhaD/arsenite permease-like protein
MAAAKAEVVLISTSDARTTLFQAQLYSFYSSANSKQVRLFMLLLRVTFIFSMAAGKLEAVLILIQDVISTPFQRHSGGFRIPSTQ